MYAVLAHVRITFTCSSLHDTAISCNEIPEDGMQLPECRVTRHLYCTTIYTGVVGKRSHTRPSNPALCETLGHTPSTAFRHLPPNSARFGYATEGAFFISAHLSSDVVSALRKVWVLIIKLWKQPSAQACT